MSHTARKTTVVSQKYLTDDLRDTRYEIRDTGEELHFGFQAEEDWSINFNTLSETKV
ncbi:MAG: hypothetical protein ACK52L_12905 [Pirellula sp.]